MSINFVFVQAVGFLGTILFFLSYQCKSNKNLFWDINGNCQPTVDNSLEKWQKKGKDIDSIIADPMFIDYKNYNFTISENSPAVKLGFKPIIGFPATDK